MPRTTPKASKSKKKPRTPKAAGVTKPSKKAASKKAATKVLTQAAAQASPTRKPRVKRAATAPTRERIKRSCKQERQVLTPVIPCLALLAGRPDEDLLKDHLGAIDLHRQTYERRIQQAQDKLNQGDASEAHAIPAHKAKITEAHGEQAATMMMINQYAQAKGFGQLSIVWTFTAGTGIDQLWYTGLPEDKYVIVEAKGPGAKLSDNAAKGDQMSSQWVRASLQQVINSKSATDADRKHAERMLDAMDTGPKPEVYGAVIEANPLGPNGEVSAHEVACPDKGVYHFRK